MSNTDLTLLSSAMDCLVPPVDDLPGAGAMGLAPEEAACCLRFSLSSLSTEDEIATCIEQIPAVVARMRRNFISA